MSINKVVSPMKGNVGKSLLLLNNTLPKDKGSIWVTVQEMRDRLVYWGVNTSLTVDMVAYVLRTSNRGNCIIQKRDFNKVAYYVPTVYEEFSVLPTDQRFTANNKLEWRIDINPDKRYFITCSEATSYLDEVNAVLDAYDEENRRMEEELIELQNTPEDNLWHGCRIGPYDGNIIMQCSRMDDFIELVSEHSEQCGHKVSKRALYKKRCIC
jgi:hypothetical protein